MKKVVVKNVPLWFFPFISVNKLSFDLLGFVGLGGSFPFKDLLLYYVFFSFSEQHLTQWKKICLEVILVLF